METIKFLSHAFCSNEFRDQGFIGIVELKPNQLQEIAQLQSLLKENKLYKLQKEDDTVVFYNQVDIPDILLSELHKSPIVKLPEDFELNDEKAVPMECPTLDIFNAHFGWSAYTDSTGDKYRVFNYTLDYCYNHFNLKS